MVDATPNAADSFVVTSKAQRARLVASGMPEESVHYAGITAGSPAAGEPPNSVGADAPVPEPLKIANNGLGTKEPASKGTHRAIITQNRQSGSGELAFDALVVGDVPDDRPEAAGISMSTHATMWRECVKIATDQTMKNKSMQAAELLALAEQHCEAKLRDARIRGEMVQKIEERLLPAAFARHLARELTSRFKVAFTGANWPEEQRSTSRPVTAGTALAHTPVANAIARRARWVVLPFISTAAIQTAVDVLAAGGRVALRAGRTPLSEAHPELRDIAQFIPTFTNARQAVEIVGKESWWSVDEIRSTLESLSLGSVLMRVVEAARRAGEYQPL
jgi:hypothetical protein